MIEDAPEAVASSVVRIEITSVLDEEANFGDHGLELPYPPNVLGGKKKDMPDPEPPHQCPFGIFPLRRDSLQ